MKTYRLRFLLNRRGHVLSFHNPGCEGIEADREWSEWAKRWPNHCGSCRGSGIGSYYGGGEYEPPEAEPCEDCILPHSDQPSHCPRCALPFPEDDQALNKCDRCGWDAVTPDDDYPPEGNRHGCSCLWADEDRSQEVAGVVYDIDSRDTPFDSEGSQRPYLKDAEHISDNELRRQGKILERDSGSQYSPCACGCRTLVRRPCLQCGSDQHSHKDRFSCAAMSDGSRRYPRQPQCFRCKAYGHTQKICPLPAPEYPPAPCAYCGEAGHNARWCPSIPDDFEWPTPEYTESLAEDESSEVEDLIWVPFVSKDDLKWIVEVERPSLLRRFPSIFQRDKGETSSVGLDIVTRSILCPRCEVLTTPTELAHHFGMCTDCHLKWVWERVTKKGCRICGEYDCPEEHLGFCDECGWLGPEHEEDCSELENPLGGQRGFPPLVWADRWPDTSKPEHLKKQDVVFEAVETSEELEWITSQLDPENDYQPYESYHQVAPTTRQPKGARRKINWNTIANKLFQEEFGHTSEWTAPARYALIVADEVDIELQQTGNLPLLKTQKARLREIMGPVESPWNHRKASTALIKILEIRYPELTLGLPRTRWMNYMDTQEVPYSPALKNILDRSTRNIFHGSRRSMVSLQGRSRRKQASTLWDNPERFVNDILLLYAKQGGRCAVTGSSFPTEAIEVSSGLAYELPWTAPSIDRIDNEVGYQPDNVRLVTLQVQFALNKYPDRSLIGTFKGITANKLHRFIRPNGDMMNLLVPNVNQLKLYLDPDGPYGFTLEGVGSVHEAESADFDPTIAKNWPLIQAEMSEAELNSILEEYGPVNVITDPAQLLEIDSNIPVETAWFQRSRFEKPGSKFCYIACPVTAYRGVRDTRAYDSHPSRRTDYSYEAAIGADGILTGVARMSIMPRNVASISCCLELDVAMDYSTHGSGESGAFKEDSTVYMIDLEGYLVELHRENDPYETPVIGVLGGVYPEDFTPLIQMADYADLYEAEGNDEESPHTRAIAGVSDSVAKFANANDTDDWAYAFGGLVAGFVLMPLVGTLISGWLMSKLKKRNLIPWEKDDAEQG